MQLLQPRHCCGWPWRLVRDLRSVAVPRMRGAGLSWGSTSRQDRSQRQAPAPAPVGTDNAYALTRATGAARRGEAMVLTRRGQQSTGRRLRLRRVAARRSGQRRGVLRLLVPSRGGGAGDGRGVPGVRLMGVLRLRHSSATLRWLRAPLPSPRRRHRGSRSGQSCGAVWRRPRCSAAEVFATN